MFQGQKKISSSKVFIVGAGGLGCPIADLLCRAGVCEIGIIDHDKISLSPHIGGSTVEAQERIGDEIVKEIKSFYKFNE